MNIIGDVEGKTCILIDDMIDTAARSVKVADKIREKGAAKVYAACVHGVLSGAAHDLIAKSSLEEMILTDSIPVHALAGGKLHGSFDRAPLGRGDRAQPSGQVHQRLVRLSNRRVQQSWRSR